MFCPKCGLEIPEFSNFCGGCGAALPSRTVLAEVKAQEFPQPERRRLSVMFCDLVGSTELSGQLDPEELHRLISDYQRVCANVIGRHAGQVAQFLGDGLLAYFGYPVAHEDDVRRAVRAGLEIVAAVSGVQAQPGKSLRVRVAVHTGLAVVGHLDETNTEATSIIGDTPNIAARLQNIAEPGTVIISAPTYRLVEGYFDCQSLGMHTLKGVAEPMELYSVLEESEIESRFERAVSSGLTPFVSRESEIALLLQRWELARSGAGQVVFVSGEAGIGKSRLTRVLKERTTGEEVTEVSVRCSPYYQDSALHPLIGHFQRLLQLRQDSNSEAKLRTLERVLKAYGCSESETVPLFAALLSLPYENDFPPLAMTPQRQKQKTFETVVAWLLNVGRQHPTRVIVEDVHWADPSTLELLGLLIEQIRETRLFVALIFRPDFLPPWRPQPHVFTVALGRLSRPAAESMIESVVGTKKIPADLVGEMLDKTGGVPLFVEELTRTVLESGMLREADGHYELTSSLQSLTVPSTLYESLMARLDRLGTAKEVAQLAAVVGKDFSHELLEAISPLSETELADALGRLVDAQLLDRHLLPQMSYSFRHALFRDAAYESLLRSTRRQYHRKIGDVLKERFPETIDTQPEVLAGHFTEAGQIEEAVPLWQRAGQRALERSANQEAIRHLTKGLELLNVLPETPQHLEQGLLMRVTLGGAVMIVRGFGSQEAQNIFVGAGNLCRRVSQGPLVFQTFWALWVSHAARGEHREARESAEQCLKLAEAAQDTGLLLEAHQALGVSLLLLGEFSQGLAHLKEGSAIYDPSRHAALAYVSGQDSGVACLAHQGWALWFLGFPDQARTRIREALALAKRLSHPVSSAAAANLASWVDQWVRDPQAARKHADEAVALSTERGFEMWQAMGTIGQGWALAQQGLLDEGTARLRAGLTALRSTGAEVLMPYFLGLLAQAYVLAGQVDEGLAVLDESQAALDEGAELWWQAELYRLKGELLLARPEHRPDDREQAHEYFRRACTVAREQHAKSLELRAAMSLSRLLSEQGRKSEARRMLSEVYGWFTEGFDTPDLQEAQKLSDQLAGD